MRRQIFMTRAENWAKFSAHFRVSFVAQSDPQIFSQNSSQFITPCLVADIIKFHLCELLGVVSRNMEQKYLKWALFISQKGLQRGTPKAPLPPLVAQCSATPATVAATPPCSATPFQTQISVRHLPGQGGGQGATPKFLGGVARHRCYTCKTL